MKFFKFLVSVLAAVLMVGCASVERGLEMLDYRPGSGGAPINRDISGWSYDPHYHPISSPTYEAWGAYNCGGKVKTYHYKTPARSECWTDGRGGYRQVTVVTVPPSPPRVSRGGGVQIIPCR